MAYSLQLAKRLERLFKNSPQATQKKMFGGVCFMWNGHMCCGALDDKLVLRVGKERYEAALSREHTSVMDFTKRVMRGMVYVEKEGIATDEELADWVGWGIDFCETLPPKP